MPNSCTVSLQDTLINGPLGKSGFLAAFSLILLSEIGDKTFFIAALLAMKLGKWVSFFGSVASLSVMTVISVSIGAVFSRVGGDTLTCFPQYAYPSCLISDCYLLTSPSGP